MQYPIRIAQIMGKMNNGGVEAVILNYYRAIDKTKFQFDFIVDSDSFIPQKEEIESLGGRIYIVPPYSKINAYAKALTEIFNKNKYLIVHSNLTTLNIFPLRIAKKCGIPFRISHGHNTMGKGEFFKSLLKIGLKPFSNLYQTQSFACSNAVGQWLFNGKKYEVIKNAFIYKDFYFNEDKRFLYRKKYNIGENDIVIGHIGRFNVQKNHAFIMQLFNRLYVKNHHYKLFLIGNGPLKGKVKDYINKNKLNENVIIVDSVNNPNDFYNIFDLFILPSNYEGFGNVAIEAQVNGLQVVASDKVPQETKLCNRIIYEKLNLNKWEHLILNLDYKRSHLHIDSTYDIEFNIKKLESYYDEWGKNGE